MKVKQSLFLILLFPLCLFGKIIDSPSFSDLVSYADENTLFAFDIDNTLIDSEQQLGSSQSSYYFYEKFVQLGIPKEMASQLEIQRWMMIQPLIKVRTIDDQTAQVIKQLKEKGAQIILVTARNPAEASFTHDQLSSVSIQIENQMASETFIQLQSEKPSTYFNGILFCGIWNTKGGVLTAFLKQTQSKPKKIVFIDDKLKHVQEVEKSIEKMGIDFIGVRFSGSDDQIAQLDPKILELQWSLFPFIISDEEAKKLINEN